MDYELVSGYKNPVNKERLNQSNTQAEIVAYDRVTFKILNKIGDLRYEVEVLIFNKEIFQE